MIVVGRVKVIRTSTPLLSRLGNLHAFRSFAHGNIPGILPHFVHPSVAFLPAFRDREIQRDRELYHDGRIAGEPAGPPPPPPLMVMAGVAAVVVRCSCISAWSLSCAAMCFRSTSWSWNCSRTHCAPRSRMAPTLREKKSRKMLDAKEGVSVVARAGVGEQRGVASLLCAGSSRLESRLPRDPEKPRPPVEAVLALHTRRGRMFSPLWPPYTNTVNNCRLPRHTNTV